MRFACPKYEAVTACAHKDQYDMESQRPPWLDEATYEAMKAREQTVVASNKRLVEATVETAKTGGEEASAGRVANKPNVHGFACPICWCVPPTLRNDGVSIPRHFPATPGVKLFRDTEFCDGQGRAGVKVLDSNWSPGREPEQKVSAKKWSPEPASAKETNEG